MSKGGSVPMAVADEIWKVCDKNGDGTLTFREFKFGFNQWLAANNKGKVDSERKFRQMFLGFDRDGDNQVNKKEFYDQLVNLEDRKSGMARLFKESDKDGGGLSKSEFRAFVEKSGVVRKSEIDKFVDDNFRLADKDRSGNISLEEFAKYMDISIED